MNKLIGTLALMLAGTTIAFAQDEQKSTETKKSTAEKFSRDFVMVQATYEAWNTPDSTIKFGGVGRGFNAYLCYDFPIKKSNFSFAPGLGISVSNVYFNNQLLMLNTASNKAYFQNVDTVEGLNLYKSSKVTTAYLEAPFELRYFSNNVNRNIGFKASIGMRVGVLVGAHTKNKNSVSGYTAVEKVNTTRYFQTWRFAPIVRVGWGNFSVFGSYNISQLFKAGEGPEVYPYSIGICLSGL